MKEDRSLGDHLLGHNFLGDKPWESSLVLADQPKGHQPFGDQPLGDLSLRDQT